MWLALAVYEPEKNMYSKTCRRLPIFFMLETAFLDLEAKGHPMYYGLSTLSCSFSADSFLRKKQANDEHAWMIFLVMEEIVELEKIN